MKLKVLTLNCWGIFIPFACKLKGERIKAIGEYLATFDCDIVSLQEIWSKSDYYYLKKHLLTSFPYSHYFYSGCYGSGVCVFSKHSIVDTHQHRYTLNGYAHRIFQSDWYGSKLCGLVKIQFHEFKINFYATHMHAQYDEDDTQWNAYSHHRTLQAFEMARYVSMTTGDCDLVVAVGDFNHRPDQVGYGLIRYVGGLVDAWSETDTNGATCDRPDNSFCNPSIRFPDGLRIDYIFYSSKTNVEMKVIEAKLEMRSIGNKKYNYSDHEGVFSAFDITQTANAKEKPSNVQEITSVLNETLICLNQGKKMIHKTRLLYASLFVVAFLLLLSINYCMHTSPMQNTPLTLVQSNQSIHSVDQSDLKLRTGDQLDSKDKVGGQSDSKKKVEDQSDLKNKVEHQSRKASLVSNQSDIIVASSVAAFLGMVSTVVLSLFLGFCFWYAAIVLHIEKIILTAAENEINMMKRMYLKKD